MIKIVHKKNNTFRLGPRQQKRYNSIFISLLEKKFLFNFISLPVTRNGGCITITGQGGSRISSSGHCLHIVTIV